MSLRTPTVEEANADARLRAAASVMLRALEIAEERLLIAEQHLDLGEDDSISFEHAILTVRDAIAYARGAK